MAHLDIPALGDNHKRSAFKVDQRQGKNFIEHNQARLDKAIAKRARKNETRKLNHVYAEYNNRNPLSLRSVGVNRLNCNGGGVGWAWAPWWR
jgi:hypothetical protein